MTNVIIIDAVNLEAVLLLMVKMVLPLLIVPPTGCDVKFCCHYKEINSSNKSNDDSYSSPPGIGFTFAACHLPLS